MDAENTTYWSFPPALNISFRQAYAEETQQLYLHNITTATRGIEPLIVDAVHNLTFAQRLADGFSNDGFGTQEAAVRQGDVIEFEWQDSVNRTIELNCMVCSTGAQGGSIESACDNYTNTEHLSARTNISSPLLPGEQWIFPTLEDYFALPNETCGICILTLYSMLGWSTSDYSIPFPVLQQPTTPHKLFNAENPTGTPDPSIPTLTPVPEHGKPNVGMIVGVVVGVLGGAALLALLCWWLWRKGRAKTKVLESSASSTADQIEGASVGGANRGAPDIALQRIQGVVRRPDSRASEVPPPYHEAIREANTDSPPRVIQTQPRAARYE